MKMLTLNEYLREYMENIENLKTKSNYKYQLRIIQNANTINIEELINIAKINLNRINVRNTSKNQSILCIKAFLNWLAKKTQQFVHLKTWKPLAEEPKKRQAFSNKEIVFLRNELKEFNNPQFTLIWELLYANGLRLRDFVQIPWRGLKLNNYKIQFTTSKSGVVCSFFIPEWLIGEFDKYGINYSYNTIQNLFSKFARFVRMRTPNWTKPIHAHVLRHCFGTRAVLNTGSATIAATMMGHTSSSMLLKTYITYNPEIQKMYWDQINDPTPIALEKQQLIKQLTYEKEINNHLKQILIDNGIDYEKNEKQIKIMYNESDTGFFHQKIM